MSKPNVNAKENSAANVKENGNPNGNGNGNAVSPKVQEMLRKNNEQRDRDQKFVKLVPDVPHILDFSPANCERVPNRFNPKQMRYRYSIQDPENPNKEFLEVSVGSSTTIDAELAKGNMLLKITKTGTGRDTKCLAIPV